MTSTKDLVDEFCSAFLQSRGLDSRDAEEILELRHLGQRTGDGFIPNVACAVLFAKDPRSRLPGCRFRFMRFRGEEERTGEDYNLEKDIWIEGALPKQILEAERVVGAQLREFSRLGTDGKFYVSPEYPKEAWYEAIVNAGVHRSYGLRRMHVTIKMFDDRLEIESPGGFPPMVTPDNIFEIQHSRNPHISDAMFYLKFVKMANEGARRIRDTMGSMDLPPPKFEEHKGSHATVRVTLRNAIHQRRAWIDKDAAALVGKAVFETLTEQERRIINFVAEHSRATVSEAARLVGGNWHTVKKRLESLRVRGILARSVRDDIDRDPNAFYYLPTKQGDSEPR